MTLGIAASASMNIMLVSVEERVRNRTSRHSGAQKHIRWQFLLEALVMTLAPAIGRLLSWGSPPPSARCRYSARLRRRIRQSGHPPDLSVMTMFLSFDHPDRRRVLSGWLPAMQAPNSTPSEALRYE